MTEWEGGDDWLRAQFKAYLLSLFRTVASNGQLSCCCNLSILLYYVFYFCTRAILGTFLCLGLLLLHEN